MAADHAADPATRGQDAGSGAARLVLAYWSLQDPRDLAEVIHLAAAFGAELHLLGRSLRPDHAKVARKLRSWRPALAERPETIDARVFSDAAAWARAMREARRRIAATVVEGGTSPPPSHAGERLAVLFGEETHGLPSGLIRLADERWSFPLGPGGRFFTVGQTTALVLGAVARRL